ncbi:hypothetical protein [Bailinhaonella thermotolerans]|uniref:Uncharacterized protein n=1 Tax=Bailinhaonella thermotolerans TaxID=1070861 RepID=A0A3A4AA49_9ACTN|nr:hypothetical protein [Bailinhaonella thermotolerans]RJL23234.1 hypothetical protein D5H75_33225 [Bailinhaonella thermotolerans]
MSHPEPPPAGPWGSPPDRPHGSGPYPSSPPGAGRPLRAGSAGPVPPPWPRPAAPPRPPARRAGMLAVLLIAGGLLAGGVAGAAAGFAGTGKSGPAAPGPLPAAFPHGGQRHLPGVTVSHLADRWLKGANGWGCRPWTDTKAISGARSRLYCTARDGSKYDVGVDIEYDDQTHVRRVSAECHLGPGTRYCTTLFQAMAVEIFTTRPGLRRQAAEWGRANADTDASTTLGGIRLTAELEPHRLTATPAA